MKTFITTNNEGKFSLKEENFSGKWEMSIGMDKDFISFKIHSMTLSDDPNLLFSTHAVGTCELNESHLFVMEDGVELTSRTGVQIILHDIQLNMENYEVQHKSETITRLRKLLVPVIKDLITFVSTKNDQAQQI